MNKSVFLLAFAVGFSLTLLNNKTHAQCRGNDALLGELSSGQSPTLTAVIHDDSISMHGPSYTFQDRLIEHLFNSNPARPFFLFSADDFPKETRIKDAQALRAFVNNQNRYHGETNLLRGLSFSIDQIESFLRQQTMGPKPTQIDLVLVTDGKSRIVLEQFERLRETLLGATHIRDIKLNLSITLLGDQPDPVTQETFSSLIARSQEFGFSSVTLTHFDAQEMDLFLNEKAEFFQLVTKILKVSQNIKPKPLASTSNYPLKGRTRQVIDAIVAVLEIPEEDVTPEHLTIIFELDLRDKNITQLHEDDFQGLTGLKRLLLNRNKLTALPEKVFSDLTLLEYLDLSFNQLEPMGLPQTVFKALKMLEKLYVNNNRILTPELLFYPFPGVPNRESIDLKL